MLMNPAQFKHRIIIFEEKEAEDADGFKTKSPVDICRIWAAIKTVGGREYVSAAATQNENTYRFIIRYREGLNPRMMVNYKGRIFDIESILNDDELRKTLTIVAKERV